MSDLTFVEKKPMEGREHSPEAGATVGREGCDVNLMDPEVSRRHAAFRSADAGGGLAVEDLGSTNGTYVNGSRITVLTVLKDGDEVRFGNTVWTARAAAPAGAGATSIGQAPPAAPQVTAARAVPTDIQTPGGPPQATTAQAVPAAAAQQPAQPGTPSADQVGPRGDVEKPPEVAPSAIRRVLPPPAAGQAPVFSPPGARPGGSAATRVEATVVGMIIVAVVAALLVIYFVTY